MKLLQMDCPGCGAAMEMNITENTKLVHCPYCGRQCYLDDGKREYTINKNINVNKNIHTRHTDDADVIRAKNETNKDVKMLFAILGVFVLMMLFFALMMWIEDYEAKPKDGEIKMPCAVSDYKGESYEDVIRELEDLGFDNIETSAKKDLVTGWITKDGSVEKVSIGGDSDFEEGDIFKEDAEVVVIYHTFED